MKPSILILQTSQAGISLCMTALKLLCPELKRGVDFSTFVGLNVADDVKENEPQLFITDTFGLHCDESIAFNEKLREKNTQLVSICCDNDAGMIHPASFERILDMGSKDWIKSFCNTINEFRQGSLRRT